MALRFKIIGWRQALMLDEWREDPEPAVERLAGVRALAEALPSLKALRHLSLASNNVW